MAGAFVQNRGFLLLGLVFAKKVCYTIPNLKRKVVTAVNLLGIFLEKEKDPTEPVINDQTFLTFLVIGIMILAAILFVAGSVWFTKFQRELKHLNLRIAQSVSERERQHYIRRRRNLFWSIIPFVKYKHR